MELMYVGARCYETWILEAQDEITCALNVFDSLFPLTYIA